MELQFIHLISFVAWSVAVFGSTLIGFWLFEVVFLREGTVDKSVYDHKDVQVRFLTVGSEEVVQNSLDVLPEEFEDVHVIAEEEICVEGAEVHVVPEGFECDSVKKGRALEWARQVAETEKEFVLYLDEDSHLMSFPGLPDRDVIQLREEPQPTSSLLSYIADVFRMGVQFEQLSFSNLKLPLFVWGGGLAVREDVEDDITWDRASLVEDTAFAWAAVLEGATYGVSKIFVQNQAPPSVMALMRQRRRWAGGNQLESRNLPTFYRFFTRMRNYAWGLTPISALLLPVVLFTVQGEIIGGELLSYLGWALTGIIPFWYLTGVLYYPDRSWKMVYGALLLPFSALLHGLGALWGIASPPKTFEVTPKE